MRKFETNFYFAQSINRDQFCFLMNRLSDQSDNANFGPIHRKHKFSTATADTLYHVIIITDFAMIPTSHTHHGQPRAQRILKFAIFVIKRDILRHQRFMLTVVTGRVFCSRIAHA
jgi:hypothetical protein